MGSMHGPSRRGSSTDMGARRWSRRRRWTIVWWAVAWPYYLHSLCPGSPPAWQHLLDLPLPFCSARPPDSETYTTLDMQTETVPQEHSSQASRS
jgi:hypothetical protein